MITLSETFWDDLLAAISERRVIPVIGQGLVRTESGQVLSAWLADALKVNLGVPNDRLSDSPDLNEVICAHILHGRGGLRSLKTVYSRVKQLLGNLPPCSTEPLTQLARISQFDVILSTTFDDLLLKVMDQVRHGGNPKTRRVAFYPRARERPQMSYGKSEYGGDAADQDDLRQKDLPRAKSMEPRIPLEPVVYQLLGQASTQPNYALWDEDLIEFILALHQQLPDLTNLARSLQDNHLLLLGCRFSDWAVRFFLRVAKQGRLSGTSDIGAAPHYIADWHCDDDTSCSVKAADHVVLYLDSLEGNVEIVRCDPIAFMAELSRRCAGVFGTPRLAQLPEDTYLWPSPEMPIGSIFISYAREDLDAVKLLKTGLESAGCDVWFDLERLRAGDAWENVLEDQVRRRCAVFLSVISATTESKKGYYHTEREWAADEAKKYGAEKSKFYVPIIIDSTSVGGLVMEQRLVIRDRIQVDKVPGGTVSAAFAQRLLELQREAHQRSGRGN